MANISFTCTTACAVDFYVGGSGNGVDNLTQMRVQQDGSGNAFTISCSGLESYNPGDNFIVFASSPTDSVTIQVIAVTATIMQVA